MFDLPMPPWYLIYGDLFHEIKNPLTSINMLCQSAGFDPIIKEYPEPVQVFIRDYLQRIEKDSIRITSALDAMKYISRSPVRMHASISAERVICNGIPQWSALCQSKKQIFEYTVISTIISSEPRASFGEGFTYIGDSTILLQALTNLISFFVENIPSSDSRMVIELSQNIEYVSIRCFKRDTLLPDIVLNKWKDSMSVLRKPYFSLYVARMLIEAFYGKIFCDTSVEKNACITIFLPKEKELLAPLIPKGDGSG